MRSVQAVCLLPSVPTLQNSHNLWTRHLRQSCWADFEGISTHVYQKGRVSVGLAQCAQRAEVAQRCPQRVMPCRLELLASASHEPPKSGPAINKAICRQMLPIAAGWYTLRGLEGS